MLGQVDTLDSKRLNHHKTDEPFPIKVKVRGERYRQLIVEEAENADVLGLAKCEI